MAQKETARIKELFEKLYAGESWIGESLMGTLEPISAAAAAKKITPQWNSIWEITRHLISWRQNVLQRVEGNVTQAPDDNYFTPIEDQSERAWQRTLGDLKKSQQQWIGFLQQMNDEELDKMYTAKNSSYYHNIQGIGQHDAYHLGQIVMLAKHSV